MTASSDAQVIDRQTDSGLEGGGLRLLLHALSMMSVYHIPLVCHILSVRL